MSELQMSKEWIEYAQRDYETAQHIAKTMRPAPLEIICFLSQQAAEKALKSILVFHDIEAPRTHNLLILYDLCREVEPIPTQLEADCKKMSGYEVRPRYPSELSMEAIDAERALRCGGHIFSYVKEWMAEQSEEKLNTPTPDDEYDLEP